MNRNFIRILLVDDEEVLAELVHEILEEMGYKVTIYTGSAAALQAFSAAPSTFDLVVADEKMPGMSGTELAQEILEIRPGIPIILYTDFPEIAAEKKAIKIGIRAIVRKSSRMEELVHYIRRLLES
jgi:DNA-binding NtrC family response regulator